MPKRTIQIADSEGKSFYIVINQSLAQLAMPAGKAGTWRALNESYIRHNGGAMVWVEAAGTATTKHLRLLSPKGLWGLQLFEFKDFWGVNSDGSGVIAQSWVLSFEPGRITWLVMD